MMGSWLLRGCWLVASMAPCFAMAQTTVVTVLDVDSLPLAQAMVQTAEAVVGFTDDQGQLVWDCEGVTSLRVVADGFETASLDPFECTGRPVEVVLQPLERALETAVVEESRESTGARPAEVLDAKRIESVPSSTGIPDLLGTLKTSASVGSNVEGQKGIVSRGGNYDQASILVDGFPLMNATHLFGMLSMFPTGSVSDVRLFVNDKPIDQSFSLGTVVQVGLNESFAPEVKHSGQVLSSVIASEALLQRVSERLFLQFSARRSNLEAIQGLIDQTINTSESRQILAVYGFDDVSAKGSVLLGRHKVESVFLVSNDDVNYDIDFDPSVRTYENGTRWRNAMAGLGWTWFAREFWEVEAKLGWNDYSSDLTTSRTVPVGGGLDPFETSSSFTNDVRLGHTTLKTTLAGPKVRCTMGLQAQAYQVAPRFAQTTNGVSEAPEEEPSDAPWLHVHTAFAESDVQLAPRLRASAGLRRTSWRLEDGPSTHWLPRGSLELQCGDNQALMLHSERAIQGLHLLTLNDFGFVPELWLSPSASRPVQRAWQTGLRWSHAHGATRLSVDAYMRGMSDLLAFRPGVNFDQSLDDFLGQELASQGRGAVYGVELSAHTEWGPVTMDLAYAHGRSSRLFETLNAGQPFPFTFDIRHDATCALQWDVSDAWAVSCMNVFATGRWLDISNELVSLGMTNPSFGNSVFWTSYALPNNRNGYQLGNIHRVDVAVTWRKPSRSGQFQAQLGVYNLTNRVNPYATIWAEDEAGQPILDEIGLIPLLPNASLSYAWN